MKRIVALCLSLVCLLLSVLTACGGKDAPVTETDVDLKSLVSGLQSEYSLSGGVLYDSRDVPMSELLLFDYYRREDASPDMGVVTSYAVYVDDSTYEGDTEIGIFHLTAGSDKDAFLSHLRARAEGLIAYSRQYPFDTGALENAKYGSVGNYVYYVIVRDRETAIENDIKKALE